MWVLWITASLFSSSKVLPFIAPRTWGRNAHPWLASAYWSAGALPWAILSRETSTHSTPCVLALTTVALGSGTLVPQTSGFLVAGRDGISGTAPLKVTRPEIVPPLAGGDTT